MNRNTDPTSQDDLDLLLQQAHWPEPTQASADRLRSTWKAARSAPNPWRLTVRRLIPLAAAAAIALLVAAWPALRSSMTKTRDQQEVAVAIHKPDTQTPSTKIHVRPATAYERLLVLQHTASPRPTQSLDEFRLQQTIRASAGPDRAAAISNLANVATARSLPLLRQLADEPASAQAVLPALLRLGGIDEVQRAANAASSVEAKKAAFAVLMDQGDAGMQAFLAAVQTRTTAEAALGALREKKNPPIDALFAQLRQPRIDTRLAAARALAAICDHNGTIGATLRDMVERDVYRREAIAALLECNDRNAAQYLNALRVDRSVDAQVRTVQLQISQRF